MPVAGILSREYRCGDTVTGVLLREQAYCGKTVAGRLQQDFSTKTVAGEDYYTETVTGKLLREDYCGETVARRLL